MLCFVVRFISGNDWNLPVFVTANAALGRTGGGIGGDDGDDGDDNTVTLEASSAGVDRTLGPDPRLAAERKKGEGNALVSHCTSKSQSFPAVNLTNTNT